MDAKSFVLGVLAGVAGFAIVDRLIHSASEQKGDVATPASTTAASTSHVESNAGIEEGGASSARKRDAPRDPVQQREASSVGEPAAGPSVAPRDPEERRAEASDAADATGTWEMEEDWPPGFVGSDSQTAAARAAEAKDVAWSYQMDQLLTGYLAAHPPAAHFDIRSIDCRTTFCQIRAVSSSPDASPLWYQISTDIRREPWSEFGMIGSSSGKTTTGREALIMFLQRRSRSR